VTYYLTPERFRTMGLGVDFDDLEEVELRSILRAASAKVDSYCNVPMLPQRHSFKGGTIVGEEHAWDPGDGRFRGAQRRIFLRHTPIREISRLRVHITNIQYVEFAPSEIFVSPQIGVAEIVSLAMTASGLFGAFIVPNIGLGKPMARCNYTYGYSFTSIDEELEPTDAGTFRAQNQFWDDSDVIVKVDGTETTTGFEVNRTEGTIVFDETPETESVVTASYGYSMPYEIALATGLIAVNDMALRRQQTRGMAGLRRLSVGEITIERDVPRRGTRMDNLDIPGEAASLLDGFSFMRVA
jgi:hypothetical protein